MTTTTVSSLNAFDSSTYDARAEDCQEQADAAQTAADELATQANELRSALQSEATEYIAGQLELASQQTSSQAGHLAQTGKVISDVAKKVNERKVDLEGVKSAVTQMAFVLEDDGLVDPRIPIGTGVSARVSLSNRANTLTVSARQILHATDFELLAGEAALDWLMGEELHTELTGPIDLDAESIRLAAQTNSQGPLADCASLSTLYSLAMADPSFIQQHMVWDVEAGVYRVTIYDRDSGGEIVVTVDPGDVNQSDAAMAYRRLTPTWMSIYEQALRTQYPDLMDGAQYDDVAKILTGQEVSYSGASFDQIKEVLGTEPPGAVVTGVPPFSLWHLGGLPPDQQVVKWHGYSVAGFDEQGRIILINPWGPQGGFKDGQYYPGEVHLTEDEYRRWFAGATLITQPF